MSTTEDAKRLHDLAITLHEDLVGSLMVMKQKLDKHEIPIEAIADIGFFLREMERHFDEMRKDVKARKELLGRLVCLHAVRRMQAGDDAGSVRGEFATATPDLGQVPIIPKLGTPEYDDLMREIGVPHEAYKDKLVVPHWKHVQDWLNERATSGLPAPKGVTTRPDYKATFHRRKRKDG